MRFATLTGAGREERALLDRSRDALAASLLAPLSEGQRLRLVDAMAAVERLLTASAINLEAVDPATSVATHCLREYYAELNRRFDAGYDPARGLPVDEAEMRPPVGLFVVGMLQGRGVACCALLRPDPA